MRGWRLPSNTMFLGSPGVSTPKRTSTCAAVFAQPVCMTDWQTERCQDHQSQYSTFCIQYGLKRLWISKNKGCTQPAIPQNDNCKTLSELTFTVTLTAVSVSDQTNAAQSTAVAVECSQAASDEWRRVTIHSLLLINSFAVDTIKSIQYNNYNNKKNDYRHWVCSAPHCLR